MHDRPYAGPHPALIFLAAAAFALVRVRSYGMTFDEAQILEDGYRLAHWILGDVSTAATWFGPERPSPAKVLALVGALLWPDILVGLRLGPAILYAAAVSVVYATIRRPRGGWAALACATALTVAPPLSGYAAQASNEIVVTALTLIALARAAVARTVRQWAWVGALIGLACGAKISGLVVAVTVLTWSVKGASAGALGEGRAAGARRLGAMLVAGIVAFIITWPVLPLAPAAILDHVRRFATMERPPVVFFGMKSSPPWYYAPVWLVIGLPPLLILSAAWELARGSGPLTSLLRWFTGIGVVVALFAHPWLREGLRHLLPLVAVLMIAAGLGAARFVESFALKALTSRGAGRGLMTLMAVAAAAAWPCYKLFPAETGYVNMVLGGPSGAVARELPITSSGDVLNDRVLAALPAGSYAVLPGAGCDRSIYFASVGWRRLVSERARAVSGRDVRFVAAGPADRLLILGATWGRGGRTRFLGRPLLERDGVVYAAWLPHPNHWSVEDLMHEAENIK